jgi:hypothetical protein
VRIGRPVPGEEMLTLSLRDRDRLSVLRQVDGKLVSARRGAELLGLSVRQVRRLRRRFEAEGDRAVIRGLRGRPRNNTKSATLKARVLERASFSVLRKCMLEHSLSTNDRGAQDRLDRNRGVGECAPRVAVRRLAWPVSTDCNVPLSPVEMSHL